MESKVPLAFAALGIFGILLVVMGGSDVWLVLWAAALLGLSLWVGEQEKKRRLSKREDRSSREAGAGHGHPDSD